MVLLLCPLHQQGTLFLVPRQRRSPAQRCPCAIAVSQFLQQISVHRMQQVIAPKGLVLQQNFDNGKSCNGAFMHGHGHRAVELDHR